MVQYWTLHLLCGDLWLLHWRPELRFFSGENCSIRGDIKICNRVFHSKGCSESWYDIDITKSLYQFFFLFSLWKSEIGFRVLRNLTNELIMVLNQMRLHRFWCPDLELYSLQHIFSLKGKSSSQIVYGEFQHFEFSWDFFSKFWVGKRVEALISDTKLLESVLRQFALAPTGKVPKKACWGT